MRGDSATPAASPCLFFLNGTDREDDVSVTGVLSTRTGILNLLIGLRILAEVRWSILRLDDQLSLELDSFRLVVQRTLSLSGGWISNCG
jgi:hypothetical protein